MYFAGHVGDRIDLRLFLVFGMMGSGIMTIIFGLGYWFSIHVLWFYVSVQIVCGIIQSIGWPCVVAVVGNWFGKSKRGLIMGVWNSHTSVGNIIGSVVASGVLEFGWGWSFLVPGMLVILVGVLVFMFLVVSPDDLGFEPLGKEIEMSVEEGNVENSVEKVESEKAGLLDQTENSDSLVTENSDTLQAENTDSLAAIGFLEAWKLPGVAPFAFCLFFSKLVAYTFLYWLPFYIRHTGGVCGGILAGLISDVIEARALTSIVFLLLSIPALVFYRVYGGVSMIANICLMFLSGLLVNGPYALITTAVAADLGTQTMIGGNSRALATVTAIIDGTGSVGAALGPLLAGYISTKGWNNVFLMLILSVFLASLFLIRIARTEIKGKLNEGKWCWNTVDTH
ncbi:hypothetical protein G4B88_000355 [Cannabis sativa]|uniref:Major facilitator superfamily (MFS) profile domain-containing protein n=1 Tax=Cannabis sativa TaxID=3483 RepID=A0A7J6F3K7_CANSA|nr:hypothetical protein G4B88_000355 [Cannabis sativa]